MFSKKTEKKLDKLIDSLGGDKVVSLLNCSTEVKEAIKSNVKEYADKQNKCTHKVFEKMVGHLAIYCGIALVDGLISALVGILPLLFFSVPVLFALVGIDLVLTTKSCRKIVGLDRIKSRENEYKFLLLTENLDKEDIFTYVQSYVLAKKASYLDKGNLKKLKKLEEVNKNLFNKIDNQDYHYEVLNLESELLEPEKQLLKDENGKIEVNPVDKNIVNNDEKTF